jgi:hypothetical protein
MPIKKSLLFVVAMVLVATANSRTAWAARRGGAPNGAVEGREECDDGNSNDGQLLRKSIAFL